MYFKGKKIVEINNPDYVLEVDVAFLIDLRELLRWNVTVPEALRKQSTQAADAFLRLERYSNSITKVLENK